MKTPNYVFDDELYHHGIPGQRWGFRRFQNEDGSWTPEGRERYGKGDGERVKIEKAKATYNTQKYKADLKSKAQKEKDARAAKEERNRIKEAAKTSRLARREQAKIDRKQAKLDSKVKDDASLKNKLVRTKRYAMSDDELSKAIDRLKLEVEYNKQYALASKPNSALARADRFFEGATGKAALDLAKSVLPSVSTAVAKSITDYALKKNDPKELEKKNLEIEKAKVEIENLRKQSSNQQNVNKQQAQAQNNVSKEQNKVNENTNTQNVKQKKEKVKSVMNDAKTVTSNVKSTVDTGYRLYKLYSDRVSSRPVSSISNSKPVTSSIPKSALQLPASNIAGLLPARSEVLNKKR